MIDHYKIITVNHKVLNTEDLAHFIIRHDNDQELIEQLNDLTGILKQQEVLYLNTCNRVIFLFFGDHSFNQSDISGFFGKINSTFDPSQVANLDQVIEHYVGHDAINHIFEVASSIDSLVVGEREIFRQFREAYKFCNEAGLCGDNIRLVEQSTVRGAKDVYTNTSIGAKPVSVVSLAIQEFLQRDLPKDARILLIGSGETNSTVGRFLKKHKYQNIIIFNRSLDNAKSLSEELNAEARYLGTLTDYNEGFDCIFACTSAQDPIVTLEVFNKISKKSDKKLLIDLAIPNNISKSVASLHQVDYISIDSIRVRADENLKFRSSNIAAARDILGRHLEEFGKVYQQRIVERALGHLPQEISKVKDRALNLVYKDQIEALPEDAQNLILEIAAYMEKKCVAVPMKMAKEAIVE